MILGVTRRVFAFLCALLVALFGYVVLTAIYWPPLVAYLSVIPATLVVIGAAMQLAKWDNQKRRDRRFDEQTRQAVGWDEALLLGPVSAWVAEGEAQAIRDWRAKHPHPQPQPQHPPAAKGWTTLYHPEQDAFHDVPNKPDVIALFRSQGWTEA
jgi:hypothetical protein